MELLSFDVRKKAARVAACILLSAIANGMRLQILCYLLEREFNLRELTTLMEYLFDASKPHAVLLQAKFFQQCCLLE